MNNVDEIAAHYAFYQLPLYLGCLIYITVWFVLSIYFKIYLFRIDRGSATLSQNIGVKLQ